jgi:hypothetical protein
VVALAALGPSCGLLDGEGPEAAVDAGEAASAVAHLEAMRGQVMLERAGKSQPARLGYLYLKDAVATAVESTAQVRFGQGQVVEIGPDARFLIGEDRTGIVLEVQRGLILTRVPAGAAPGAGGTSLTILTPFGITRVGAELGEVEVEVSQDGARVNVLVGAVQLVSRNGETVTAGAGDRATLTTGQVVIEGRTPNEVTLEAMKVTVFAGGGKAEVKKQGSRKWKAVGRGGEPLEQGDGVRVRTGRASLQLEGSETRLGLGQSSEVVFEQGGRDGQVEVSALDLKKGAMSIALAPGRRSRVTLSGLRLESDLGGQFSVVKTRDGFEVSALAGDARLSRNGQDAAVRAGQTARLPDRGEVQVTGGDRADLSIPSRSGLRVHHPGLAEAAIAWGGEPGDYWVEVASDSKFEQRLLAGLVHSAYVNVPIPRRGALYWRVLAADRSSEVDKGSAVFSPEPPQRDLARLRNEVQDGADKTTIYFQDKPPAVTFTYRLEEGAARYRVQVYRASQLDSPMVDRTSSSSQLPLEAGVLTEGSYLWSVTPLDDKGGELRGGKMNKLEISYDNSVPDLVITSPRNGEAARGAVRATGVAPVGARLYVNGKAADLDEKNRFDMEVTPVGRPPVVIFRVSRPPASDTITVRALRRR